MDILKELCSIPTAPFLEQRVEAFVVQWVKQRRALRLKRDSAGNLLIERPGRKPRLPRWIFTAHMDHPGLVARKMLDPRTLDAQVRGFVVAPCLKNEKVVFFENGQEIRGRIIEAQPEVAKPGRAIRAASATIRVSQPIAPGTPGMFDQGTGRTKGKLFLSRVCDDLAGAAACLAMLDDLSRKPAQATVAVLLTRAEEVGFIGAIAACKNQTLLRKTDRIVAIECSAEQPVARQGNGPIIRVGDLTSVFNSSVTYFLTQQAAELAKSDKKFRCQRALMPGGTCEATVYDLYGYMAGSICVALGNYHNMDRQKERLGPESVHLDDWRQMVQLFIAIAQNGHDFTGDLAPLRKRIEGRFDELKKFL